MAIDNDSFKKALSSWASGVTVVTTKTPEGYAGLTASAFSSVSMEPPIILVCVNQSSESCAAIEAAGCFAVNILQTEQVETSNRFAFKDKRFENTAHTPAPSGAPYLDEAMTSLDCKLVNTTLMGSHKVFFGEVQHAQIKEGDPLLYYKGGYRKLTDI